MNICVPTLEDKGMDSVAYGHFGSAPYFIMVDVAAGATKTIHNGNEHHAHGACNPLAALGGSLVSIVIDRHLRRHVGGSGRCHPSGHQRSRSRGHGLRHAGFTGSHVSGRPDRDRAGIGGARLRHVSQNHRARPCAAAHIDRGIHRPGRTRRHGPWRAVPELHPLPISSLQLRKNMKIRQCHQQPSPELSSNKG